MDKLLLIDDEADVQYSFRRIFDSPDIQLTCASSGEEGLRLIPRLKPDLVLMDVRMGGISGLEALRRLRQSDARLPVIMMTAYGTTQTAIEAMKLGAYDYLLKPFDAPKLKQVVAAALQASHAMKQVVSYEPLLESEDYDVGIVGRSAQMQEVFKLIGQLAGSDATALITGESGTGKELVARAIYHHSQRADKPFLAINCAAIPENLLESELFGHEKGAFTGAIKQKPGRVEEADGGTIFLDEIADMSRPLQAKLLRFLEDGSFTRVGGTQELRVNVRLLAATNRNIVQAIRDGHFREDLFHRLNVIALQLPPLRDRKEDIPLLVEHFLDRFCKENQTPRRRFHSDAMRLLLDYDWPGNIRELENVVERAVVLSTSEVIEVGLLPESVRTREIVGGVRLQLSELVPQSSAAGAAAGAPAPTLFEIMEEIERRVIMDMLERCNWNQTEAAERFLIPLSTLNQKIKRLGIDTRRRRANGVAGSAASASSASSSTAETNEVMK